MKRDLRSREMNEPKTPQRIRWWVPLIAILAIPLSYFMPVIKQRINPPPKEESHRAIRFTSGQGLDSHPSFASDGTSLVYASDTSGHFEIYMKELDASAREIAITNDGKENVEPALSPDGRSIAYTSLLERGVFVATADGLAPKRVSEFGSQPAWSSDGKRIAFRSFGVVSMALTDLAPAGESTIWQTSVDGVRPVALTKPNQPEGRHHSPAFSSDGKHLAFLSAPIKGGEMTLWEMNLETKEVTQILTEHPETTYFAYAMDGASVYFAGRGDKESQALYLLRRDVKTRNTAVAARMVKSFEFAYPRDLAVDVKGQRVAYAATNASDALWETKLPGETRAVTEDPALGVSRMLFSADGQLRAADPMQRTSPDGKSVASLREAGGRLQLWRRNAQVAWGDREVVGVAWAPDSKQLAVSVSENHQTNVSILADGPRALVQKPGLAWVWSWSSDGQKIAVAANWDGPWNAYLVDAATGAAEKITKNPAMRVFVRYPALSPQGDRLVYEVSETKGNVFLTDLR